VGALVTESRDGGAMWLGPTTSYSSALGGARREGSEAMRAASSVDARATSAEDKDQAITHHIHHTHTNHITYHRHRSAHERPPPARIK
jgi:hypothetical protein